MAHGHKIMTHAPLCYTCGTPITDQMKEDYIEGVYLNREHPKNVLDRIARSYSKTGKMNLCCKGNLMTRIITPSDIMNVEKKVQEREETQERTRLGLPPKEKSKEIPEEQILKVPLSSLNIGVFSKKRTLDPEKAIQVIVNTPEGWNYKAREYKTR